MDTYSAYSSFPTDGECGKNSSPIHILHSEMRPPELPKTKVKQEHQNDEFA